MAQTKTRTFTNAQLSDGHALIPGTLKRFARFIESIDDERGTQNGYWVNLKKGFIDSESGCHAIHEDTLTACASRLRYFVKPCQCEDCR